MSDVTVKPDNLLEIAPPVKPPFNLDLGCGQACREGFEGVDIVPGPGVRHVVNLWKFPWPFQTDSVDEIFCSHHVEHIPMCYVTKDNEYLHVPKTHEDIDLFFAFFNEMYRVLKPEGKATIICPSATSDRGFQDPTHRRFIVSSTWLYLSEDWRKSNKLDHYGITCAFAQELQATYSLLADGRTDEVKQRMGETQRNVLLDWILHLVCKK